MSYRVELTVIPVRATVQRQGVAFTPADLYIPPSFATTNPAPGEALYRQDSRTRAWQPGENHRRSVQTSLVNKNGESVAGALHKGRDYAQLLTAHTEKGGHWPCIEAVYNRILNKFELEGAMEQYYVARMVAAGNILSKEGVEVDVTWRITRPEEFYYKGKMLTKAELRESLIKQIVERDPQAMPQRSSRNPFIVFVTPEQLTAFLEYFDNNEFVMQNRGQQVGVRMSDFVESPTIEIFRERVREVFDYLNLWQRISTDQKENNSDGEQVPYIKIFHIGEENERDSMERTYEDLEEERLQQQENAHYYNEKIQQDIDWLFFSFIPQRIGQNLGRMAKKGLAHRFLHKQNVSGVGSIVDLDSVQGEALGDKPVTDGELLADVYSILSVQRLDSVLVVLMELQNANYISRDRELLYTFVSNFLHTYVTERWGENWMENQDAQNTLRYLSIRNSAVARFHKEASEKYIKAHYPEQSLFAFNTPMEVLYKKFIATNTEKLKERAGILAATMPEGESIVRYVFRGLTQEPEDSKDPFLPNPMERAALYFIRELFPNFRIWAKKNLEEGSTLSDLLFWRALYEYFLSFEKSYEEKIMENEGKAVTRILKQFDPKVVVRFMSFTSFK